MSEIFCNVVIHIILRVGDRQMSLPPSLQDRLHNYLTNVAGSHGSRLYGVGGTGDHVHILCSQPPDLSFDDLLGYYRQASALWIKQQGEEYQSFCWHDYYTAFTISPDNLHEEIQYINRQPQYHESVSFADEQRRIFDDIGIDYDEEDIHDWNETT